MIMARNEDGTYSQVGFVKDNAGIDTEYIYDKDGDIVFEKGFTRETSGTVPLTINGIGKDLKDWSITGNIVQNGNPSPDNPIMPQGCGDLETVGTKAGQYKILISSANTTTPVYLGEVETTRKIRKLVLTGEETWYLYSTNDVHQFYTQDTAIGGDASSSAYSTITPYGMTASNRKGDYGCYTVTRGNEIAFQMYGSRVDIPTQTEWKAYLAAQYAAGTPVTVWYVLATPETGIINEPLMKIGDYADTLSMEQAGVEIPTVNGTTVIDVDTKVEPSNIYIKYKSNK